MSPTLLGVLITAGVSAVGAIAAVIITYALTKKREHEADWRKLQFEQYRELVISLSGVVKERATPDAHRRFADAVNSMSLVGTARSLAALSDFLAETSHENTERNGLREDFLLDALLRTMRSDIHPKRSGVNPASSLRLFGLPPEAL